MNMSEKRNQEAVIKEPTRRQAIIGAAVTVGALALGSRNAWAQSGEEISHTCAAIQQEVIFKASRKRVYDALTETKQFDKVVQLSEAMKGGMPPGAAPTNISREVGGAFMLFGGYVSGRHIELVPNERIVQAWRPQSWKPGVYSIVKFELADEGAGTKLVLDHTGFPDGTAEHLAGGWKVNYWEPLEKYLR
jgi:uncharacterized protein YndB with AHSA1/START domain